jgi:hypothetical protein
VLKRIFMYSSVHFRHRICSSFYLITKSSEHSASGSEKERILLRMCLCVCAKIYIIFRLKRKVSLKKWGCQIKETLSWRVVCNFFLLSLLRSFSCHTVIQQCKSSWYSYNYYSARSIFFFFSLLFSESFVKTFFVLFTLC